jgi:hypothetical protein
MAKVRIIFYLHISLQCCHDDTKRVITCTQDTQCAAGVSCDRLFMECTHDEHCMHLALGTCSIRAGTATREYALRYPRSTSSGR